MRSKLALALVVIAGCAKPGTRTCWVVSSWGSPAERCEPPPAPPPEEPKPEPPPPPDEPKPPPPQEKIELKKKIEFKTDSTELLGSSTPVLDEVVKTMKDHPEIKKVRIEGHTDSTSTPDHNQKLSEGRAASVKQYLIKHGIAAERLTSQGFGQDKPIASNDTEEGRSQNRRVEIYIVEKN